MRRKGIQFYKAFGLLLRLSFWVHTNDNLVLLYWLVDIAYCRLPRRMVHELARFEGHLSAVVSNQILVLDGSGDLLEAAEGSE